MSVLRTVGTGVAWNTAAGLAVKVFAIANIFLILQRLSVYEYGILQLVLSVFSTVATLLLPGLITSVIADLARTREEGRAHEAAGLARQYFILQLSLGIAGFCLLYFGASTLAEYLGYRYAADFISIIAFLFLVNPLSSTVNMLANVELRFKLQSGLAVADEALKFLWMFLLFYVAGLGTEGVLWAMVLAPLSVLIVALPWTHTLIWPLVRAQTAVRVRFRAILESHRRWGIATSYVGTLNQNVRIWTVQLFLGTEAVGLYSFAYGMLSQASSILTFSQIANPLLARAAATQEKLADYANRVFKYHIWLVLAALPIGIAVTPLFVQTLFPAFAPAVPLTMIMLLALMPSAIAIVSSAVYPALRLQKDFFKAMLLKLGVTALLLPVLILSFGLLGAAIEIVVTNSISVLERTRALRKRVPGFFGSVKAVSTVDAVDRDLFKRSVQKGLERLRASV